MKNEKKTNEKLEKLLLKYFPESDTKRGEALVLIDQANKEIKKARQQGYFEGRKVEREIRRKWFLY